MGACLECLCPEFLTSARRAHCAPSLSDPGHTGYIGTGKLSHSLCGRSGPLSVTVGASISQHRTLTMQMD